MIDRVLEAAKRAVDNADALWRREEQTGVAFESGRLKAAGISEEAGLNLRVVSNGRMGVVGTTSATPDPEALIARARASAELGEMVELAFPDSSPESHCRSALSSSACSPVSRYTSTTPASRYSARTACPTTVVWVRTGVASW